jgi:hypothetical protein
MFDYSARVHNILLIPFSDKRGVFVRNKLTIVKASK